MPASNNIGIFLMAAKVSVTKDDCRLGISTTERRRALFVVATANMHALAADKQIKYPTDAAAARQCQLIYYAALREVFGGLEICPRKLFR
jgi:hypothetical protein